MKASAVERESAVEQESAVERPESAVERPVNNTWKIYKKKIKWDFD